jgi:hypothetical protein
MSLFVFSLYTLVSCGACMLDFVYTGQFFRPTTSIVYMLSEQMI